MKNEFLEMNSNKKEWNILNGFIESKNNEV